MSIKGMQRTVFVTELKQLQPDISEAALKYILESIQLFEAEAGLAGYQACLQNIGYHEPEWQDDANVYAASVKAGTT